MEWTKVIRRLGAPALVLLLISSQPAASQFLPKKIIDRAIEARSSSDIAKDNDIVIKVNGLMGEQGTAKASTQIYEQRLLITGLFDDKAAYDKFEKGVRAIPGVKKLYWHVIYMSTAEQEKRKLLDWGEVLAMESKAQGRLIGTSGVADVNFRISGDPFGTLYVLGRARSKDEETKAMQRARDGDQVKKVIDYVEMRP